MIYILLGMNKNAEASSEFAAWIIMSRAVPSAGLVDDAKLEAGSPELLDGSDLQLQQQLNFLTKTLDGAFTDPCRNLPFVLPDLMRGKMSVTGTNNLWKNLRWFRPKDNENVQRIET